MTFELITKEDEREEKSKYRRIERYLMGVATQQYYTGTLGFIPTEQLKTAFDVLEIMGYKYCIWQDENGAPIKIEVW